MSSNFPQMLLFAASAVERKEAKAADGIVRLSARGLVGEEKVGKWGGIREVEK